MLDDPGLDLAETIAAILAAALFLIASLSSIRALESLSTVIREKRPDQWAYPGSYSPHRDHYGPPMRARWLSLVVLGFVRLGPPDDDYRAVLWTARRRMMLCGLLLIAILAGIIWFSSLNG